MLAIEVANEQDTLPIDEDRLRDAAALVLKDAGIRSGSLSIAIVDDPAIHELNRQFLQHDYPTDVLSFLLERDGDRLDGEVIVSSDTAARLAREVGWSAHDELVLYVVHGTLHLVGYDDLEAAARGEMRSAERRMLAQLGLEPRGPTET